MDGVRFDPPQVDITAELCWVLGAAFGPGLPEMANELDPEGVLAVAARLDLASRIGARFDDPALSKPVDEGTAREIRVRAHATAAHALKARAMAVAIGKIVAREGIDAVVLKGGALLLLDVVAPGARNVGDLDILVRKDEADRLQGALIDHGWRASDLPGSRHQLPILGHRSGVYVEVHIQVPGVRLCEGNATLGEVVESGLCRSLGSSPGGLRVAGPQLLLAHVIAHGVHQHGLAPSAYPMARMIADVQDLVVSRAEWDAFIDGGFRWIDHVVKLREAKAVWAVADGLRQGYDPGDVLGGCEDVGRLLRHIVAGVFDDGYRESLNLRNIRRATGDTSLREIASKALFLTRGQVDAIYGRPESGLGYLGWRLWRPFGLVGRTVKYGRAWLWPKLRRR